MTMEDTGPPTGGTPTGYTVPRGSCPKCSSPEVEHLVIGMPAHPDDFGSGPTWLRWVGCVHPGYSRRCAICESTWTDPETIGLAYLDMGSLLTDAAATSLEGLAGWVSEEFELDAWALVDEEGLHIGFVQSAVLIEFPIGIDHFWETLEELHDEVAEQLEDDASD